MSINETQYEIDIEALQRALVIIHSNPVASLVIEPHRVQLTISGQYAWNVHGIQEIARVLDRTEDRFYNSDPLKQVEPVLDKSADPARQFVVIVQSNGVCDYIPDAAGGHQVNESVVKAAVADYRLNDCFTLVFSLDGGYPYVLPNSMKPGAKSSNST